MTMNETCSERDLCDAVDARSGGLDRHFLRQIRPRNGYAENGKDGNKGADMRRALVSVTRWRLSFSVFCLDHLLLRGAIKQRSGCHEADGGNSDYHNPRHQRHDSVTRAKPLL